MKKIEPDIELLAGLLKTAADRKRNGLCGVSHSMISLITTIWPDENTKNQAVKALGDNFFAVGMLYNTIISGFRGNPNHLRPFDRDYETIVDDLYDIFKTHNRIVESLNGWVNLPIGGLPVEDLEGDGGWCDLCGQCCCHCGTVPKTEQQISYPSFWYHVIAGEAVMYQPYCLFLFQTNNAEAFYCGIHEIKPVACRVFDRSDCDRGRSGRGILQS